MPSPISPVVKAAVVCTRKRWQIPSLTLCFLISAVTFGARSTTSFCLLVSIRSVSMSSLVRRERRDVARLPPNLGRVFGAGHVPNCSIR